MRIKSPLSNLSETIEQVRASAAQYRETLERNEAATRAVLVDPILRALGWDIANTYMVEVEKTLQLTRVDYALYDRNRSVRVVVEAKQLGANLDGDSITKSIFTYAHTFATNQIFLTDGLVWKHITIGEPGIKDIHPVNFGEGNVVDCAAYLVQHLDAARFWPEEQTIDELAQRVLQLESNLATLQKQVTQLSDHDAVKPDPVEPTQAPSPLHILPTASGTANTEEFVPLDSISEATSTAPSLLRLPNGIEVKVHRWKDVLLECCKFALASNKNIPIPLPDRAGKKVSLFSTVKPPTGISFVREEYNGQAIYIYTNYDANNCIRNAAYILKRAPSVAQGMKAAVIYR